MAISHEELIRVVGELEARTGNNRGLDEALVDEAQATDHPLHDEFHFGEDARLAHERRLEIARKLIKVAKINHTDPVTNRTYRVPAFIRNPFGPPGSFVPTPRLRDDRDMAMEAIRKEFERIHAAYRRAENVAATVPDMQPLVSIERERIAALMRRFESGT